MVWLCLQLNARNYLVMTSQTNEASELRDPNNPILDQYGLATLLGISPKSIPAKRSRTPNELPPPFFRRPLRWRRDGVLEWMKQQEAIAQGRAERLAVPSHSVSKPLRSTTPVRRVCAQYGIRARGSRWSSRPAVIDIFAFRASSLGTVTRCAA